MQQKKYNKTAGWLLDLNAKQSAAYSTPEAKIKRRLYREQHPTEIGAFKCMDGRLNLPVFTETPPGIIQPFRTMGGIFDLGDERLGRIVEDSVKYAQKMRRRYLPLCTYHFSKGKQHRGCAGHKYDTIAGIKGAKRLAEQFRFFHGKVSNDGFGYEVYPVVAGMETDMEALVFNSKDGKIFSIADHVDASRETCTEKLREIFPDMPKRMFDDLLEPVIRNQHHVRELKKLDREPIDLEHRESTICFGRGFDWLHTPNKALIIGPFGNDLSDSIVTAGNLLVQNIEKGRIDPLNGIVIMTAGLYYEEGMNRNRINLKAYELYTYIKKVLEKNVPELFKACDVQYLVGVTSHDTRAFTEIDVTEYEKRFDDDFSVSPEEKEAITVTEEVTALQ